MQSSGWPAALKSVEAYLGFLRERFDPARLDEELEARAFAYVVDPPAMQKLIVDNANKPLESQKRELERTFIQWKGNLEQVDDVLIIGIKI